MRAFSPRLQANNSHLPLLSTRTELRLPASRRREGRSTGMRSLRCVAGGIATDVLCRARNSVISSSATLTRISAMLLPSIRRSSFASSVVLTSDTLSGNWKRESTCDETSVARQMQFCAVQNSQHLLCTCFIHSQYSEWSRQPSHCDETGGASWKCLLRTAEDICRKVWTVGIMDATFWSIHSITNVCKDLPQKTVGIRNHLRPFVSGETVLSIALIF